MASTRGRTNPSLRETLFEQGYRFDFFEAVRVLERVCADRQAVGRGAAPDKEIVRFRSQVSLTFPASAIHELTHSEDGQPEMTVAFMGLAGVLGVLPRHYTEMILERVRQKDFTLRDFLDLFNHRFISLFYRAWEKYRFPVAYERAVSTKDRFDPFSLAVFDLMGMGTKGLRERLRLDGETLLFYAGLLAQKPHSASALEALLGDYFEAPVKTEQFIGQWLVLSTEQRSQLTSADSDRGCIGSAILGSRFWNQQAKFSLRIGPLNFARFRQFLPREKLLDEMLQLTHLFVGQELDFEVQLVLKAAEVPQCRLGKPDAAALRLGWSSWLKTKEFSRDAADAVIRSHWTKILSA